MSDVNPAFKHAYDQPEKRGMSGCAKAVIIIGILSVVGVVTCCGGSIFYFRNAVATEPAKVREVSNKILEWDGIEGVNPVFGLDTFFMQMVVFGSEEEEFVVLVNSRWGFGDDLDKARKDMRTQMNQSMSGNEEMEETNTLETKEVDYSVRGTPVTFNFKVTEGIETKRKFYELTGFVEGKDKPALMFMRLAEAKHSEDDIRAAIESIR